MFIETWRAHWGLRHDPFASEDADKDVVLGLTEVRAVHSAFDRLFGDPASPAPGIVFGEKGSGKSCLRLHVRRRLDAYNRAHAGARVLCTDYAEFDGFLERFKNTIGGRHDSVAGCVLEHWVTADHLDSMLSIGVTRLVEELFDKDAAIDKKSLTRKQKIDLLLLATLTLGSRRETTMASLGRLGSALSLRRPRGVLVLGLRILLVLLSVLLALVPLLGPRLGFDVQGPAWTWYGAGAVLLGIVGLHAAWSSVYLSALARRATRSVRVVHHDPAPLTRLLASLSANERKEMPIPRSHDEATRYELLARFQVILAASGYRAWYVLLDRVDEPSSLNADPKAARRFVETLLDHKLLQVPGMALKLFLPIEFDELQRSATPEKLKMMRLDKSNLVPTLEWTGQELVEIARARVRASGETGSTCDLHDFFASDVDPEYLRDTLQTLGTPRYAFGFLSSAITEHARNLPDDLPQDAESWRIARAQLDIVRAAWLERASLLRRSLN